MVSAHELVVSSRELVVSLACNIHSGLMQAVGKGRRLGEGRTWKNQREKKDRLLRYHRWGQEEMGSAWGHSPMFPPPAPRQHCLLHVLVLLAVDIL